MLLFEPRPHADSQSINSFFRVLLNAAQFAMFSAPAHRALGFYGSGAGQRKGAEQIVLACLPGLGEDCVAAF